MLKNWEWAWERGYRHCVCVCVCVCVRQKSTEAPCTCHAVDDSFRVVFLMCFFFRLWITTFHTVIPSLSLVATASRGWVTTRPGWESRPTSSSRRHVGDSSKVSRSHTVRVVCRDSGRVLERKSFHRFPQYLPCVRHWLACAYNCMSGSNLQLFYPSLLALAWWKFSSSNIHALLYGTPCSTIY